MIQVELWTEGRYGRTVDLPALPALRDNIVIGGVCFEVTGRAFHTEHTAEVWTIRIYVRELR